LQGANLDFAELQQSVFARAGLQGATLRQAGLQGADLKGAELQGATLDDAQLQAASLEGAQFVAASLDRANLQGASFRDSNAPGEDGSYTLSIPYASAVIAGKFLRGAQLQGASLEGALLQGASFDGAQLQGATASQAFLDHAQLNDAYVWRARGFNCGKAIVSRPKTDPILELRFRPGHRDRPIMATVDDIADFIDRAVVDIPDGEAKVQARERLSAGLIADQTKDDTIEIAKAWSGCEAAVKKTAQHDVDAGIALFLRDLLCNAREHRKANAVGVYMWVSNDWVSGDQERVVFSAALARYLLAEDCAAAKDFDEQTKEHLRYAIARAADMRPAASLPQTAPVE
jgi:uncharacterized protein YjbI with pentapeptide repeats